MLKMTVKSVTALAPVGELKPRDFFLHTNDNEVRLWLSSDEDTVWYAMRMPDNNYRCFTMHDVVMVQPLPDCDSFDWQPPRKPTALDLAKEMLQSFPREGSYFEACERLIAAMELEAKQ